MSFGLAYQEKIATSSDCINNFGKGASGWNAAIDHRPTLQKGDYVLIMILSSIKHFKVGHLKIWIEDFNIPMEVMALRPHE